MRHEIEPFGIFGELGESMKILAIDPGPYESAYVVLTDGKPTMFGKKPNAEILTALLLAGLSAEVVVEWIASYGMPAGYEVFETAYWVGRFAQQGGTFTTVQRLYRQDIKLHLCGSVRAKDGNIRRALLDRFGGDKAAKGSKAKPGPCYGMSADVWAALAVAVAWHDGVRSKIKGASA